MDPMSLAAIAAPFVAKGAEVFSKTAGEKLGGIVRDLGKAVVDKFKGDSYAEKTLAHAQDKPEAEGRQSALKEVLAEKLEDDPDFAEKVQKLVDQLEKGGARIVFDQRDQMVQGSQTNITGNVQGQVLSGVFHEKVIINIPKAEEIARLPTIPDPPSDFTGRDAELKELQAKFASGTNIIGLRGIGGVGKTALAFKLAELLRGRCTDGHVMVDMRGTGDNPATPSEAMASVIHSYHSEEKIPENEADVRTLYLKVLKGKRALILLDNVLDDKQILKLIPPKSCGFIVTSRRTIKLPGLFRKDLDVLKPEEALELLLNVWYSTSGSEKPPKVDAAWPEIANLCGFLPLALRAAASYLSNYENISPTEFVEKLKDELTRLEMIGEQGVELGVDASFNLSFQRLNAKDQQTFLCLTVFPSDFDGQAEELICQDAGYKGLSELVRWSFVDYKPIGLDYGRYKLHDLARLFALARLPAESMQSIHQSHAAYYKELLSLAGSLYLEGGESIQIGLALFDRERANIMAGQAWAEKNLEINSSAAEICKDYPNAGANLLGLRLHPLEEIFWLEKGVDAARRLKDKATEGACLGNLGIAYADMGNARKAIEYYELSLKILRDNGNREGEGVGLCNLGYAYDCLGETRKAIEYYDQSLNILRELGKCRRGESTTLGNLGFAYAKLGDTHKAIKYYEQALVIDREIRDLVGEGNDLGKLGKAYASIGETSRATEYFEQALAIAREIGDRRNEGAWLNGLGNVYSDLRETNKAIGYYEQSLKITQEIGNRQGEGNNLGNLGLAYTRLGDARKATEYFEQALAIAREIGDRRNEGTWLNGLGNIYSDLKEIRKAIECYEQALKISKKINDRQNVGTYLDKLGMAYTDLGDAGLAVEYYEAALEIARQIGGHRDEGARLMHLGNAYMVLDETHMAIDYYEQALEVAREIKDRSWEVNDLGNLGLAYADLGDNRKAIDYYDQALSIAKGIGDKRNEGALLGNLGLAYAALSDTHKAIEYYEQALIISQEIGDRMGEVNTYWNLGLAYEKEGDLGRAVDLMQVCVDFRREIGHLDVEKDADYLANVRARLEKK